MPQDGAPERSELIVGSVDDFWEVEDHPRRSESVLIRPPRSYRQAFGDEPIRVGIVEFRIMLFLASRPYYAFTRRQIAEAATAAGRPLAEAEVDEHIAVLRDQLGVLHDFVQTVPHVGYRYKA
jgi:two-component system phosphate regulon response regulator PhoB